MRFFESNSYSQVSLELCYFSSTLSYLIQVVLHPASQPLMPSCSLPQVSLEFCSFPPSYRHPKVPEGLQYYTLQAQLSGEQCITTWA